MAFARLLRNLLRDEHVGPRVVPIIPDEARTFGIDALFAEVKIYAPFGQLYEPVDAGMLLSYREASRARSSRRASPRPARWRRSPPPARAYATWGQPMVPFFIFYSMFGFQRVGDLIWAVRRPAGPGLPARRHRRSHHAQRRGAAARGRPHPRPRPPPCPNLCSYDPAFAYEVAVIIQDGIRRMYGEDPEDRFYYLTLYNENYPMPADARGRRRRASSAGSTASRRLPTGPSRRATILFSGSAYGAAVEAQRVLAEQHDVAAELWSATSYKGMRDDALAVRAVEPPAPRRAGPDALRDRSAGRRRPGPVVAVTDFMKVVPDQVARFVPGPFTALGTDGYGRSDTRAALRRHFEVDAAHIVVAVLHQLAAAGAGSTGEVDAAIATYGIDAEAPDPRVA